MNDEVQTPASAAPRPTVGRVVHYVSYGTPGGEYRSECRAAVVTEVAPWVHPETNVADVGLCVLNPAGIFFRTLADGGCRYHPGDAGHDHAGAALPALSYPGGSWHWPERA